MAENVHSKYLEFLRGGESSLGQLLDEALKRGLPMEGRAGLLPFRDTLPGSVMNERSWALPGVLAGAVNAFSAPGRALTGSDPGFQQGPEAMNFAGNLLGSSLAAAPLLGRPRLGELGITAYHGSPHKFDAFDASKIGTGEGAQAYGHGLYFAENPNVAKSYRTDTPLSQFTGQFSPNDLMSRFSVDAGTTDKKVIFDLIQKKIKEGFGTKFGSAFSDTLKNIKRPEDLPDIGLQKGALYKVDLPDEHIAKMLDWDKPLSEQTPFVRDALKKLGIEHGSGQDVVTHLGGKTGQKYLTDVGIPGIRYLDQGSRAGGQGTSNYVVFPGMEQNVKILEKK